MSWNHLPPEVRATAETTLTPGQLAVYKLELAGLSKRAIAHHLDLPRTTVNDRLNATYRRLRHAGIRQDASGNWTHHTEEDA